MSDEKDDGEGIKLETGGVFVFRSDEVPSDAELTKLKRDAELALSQLFKVVGSPDSYWKSFAEMFDLKDMGGIAGSFSKFMFYCGMHAMGEVHKDMADIKPKGLRPLAWEIYRQILNERIAALHPLKGKDSDKTG